LSQDRAPSPHQKSPATLLLEDGTALTGTGFGGAAAVAGEVVFNTAMTGYVETLTDPSYRGQILVLTYPLVGNYGVPPCRPPDSLDPPFESGRIQVQGLVVQHYVPQYSHHGAGRSLGQWLRQWDVPGLAGLNTRALTRRLREQGTMRGWLLPGEGADRAGRETARGVEMRAEVFRQVAPPEPVHYPGGPQRILLVDTGAKDNIVRALNRRGASVDRVPWHRDLAPFAAKAQGIMLANGPGDPRDLMPLVEQVRGMLDHFPGPIFGICLGNQILSLAAGGNTFKLPYGHRGVNQPVQDLLTRRCYITSQNHGYAVDHTSLPDDWEPWFVNIHDGTNEGVRARSRPFFSVQFHPESHPGPRDTEFLFDDFLRLAGALSGGR